VLPQGQRRLQKGVGRNAQGQYLTPIFVTLAQSYVL
jgi:hypothetical protein